MTTVQFLNDRLYTSTIQRYICYAQQMNRLKKKKKKKKIANRYDSKIRNVSLQVYAYLRRKKRKEKSNAELFRIILSSGNDYKRVPKGIHGAHIIR